MTRASLYRRQEQAPGASGSDRSPLGPTSVGIHHEAIIYVLVMPTRITFEDVQIASFNIYNYLIMSIREVLFVFILQTRRSYVVIKRSACLA